MKVWDACGLVADVEAPTKLATWLHNKVPGITMCSAYKPGWLASKVHLVDTRTGHLVTDFSTATDVVLILRNTTDLPFRSIIQRIGSAPPPPPVTVMAYKGTSQVPLAVPHPFSTPRPHVIPRKGSLTDVLAYTEYWRILYGALQLVDPGLSFLHTNDVQTPLLTEARRVYSTLVYYQLSPSGRVAILPPRATIPPRWFCNAPWRVILNDRRITSIGDEAFVNTPNLQRVTLSRVAHLGRTTFWMSGIHRIDFRGSTLRSLPECTFLGCLNLKVVHLNETLSRIGSSAFMNTALVHLDVPRSVKHIGVNFCRNTPLETVTLHCSVPAFAFYNCERLRSATFSATSIGQEAFYGTKSLRHVNLDGVRLISKGAFAHSGLRGTLSVDGVVCSHAFLAADAITVVVLGAETTLFPRAFSKCARLTTVLAHNTLDTTLWGNVPDTEGWVWTNASPFKNCNYMLRWENGLKLNFHIGSTTPYVDSLRWESWAEHRPKSTVTYFERVQALLAAAMHVSRASIPVTHIMSFLRDGDAPAAEVRAFSLADLQLHQKRRRSDSAARASALLSYARNPVASIKRSAVYVSVQGTVAFPALLSPWLSGEIFFPVTVWQSSVVNGVTTLVITTQKRPPYNNYHRVADRVLVAFRKAISNGCRLFRQPSDRTSPMV